MELLVRGELHLSYWLLQGCCRVPTKYKKLGLSSRNIGFIICFASKIDNDQNIIVITINLAEVYRWILRYCNARTAEEKRLAMKERCILIDVDEEIVVNAAKIKHNL